MIKELKQTSLPNYSISSIDTEPILDIGSTATIDRSKRNTTPINLPEKFGDIVHMDILYGAKTAHGGVKYALYIVDRATRYKAIYPLTNLSTDILQQIKNFCNDFGQTPRQFISDCDHKLFAEDIQKYLTEQNSRINSAPEGKQRQNSLAERSWRSILRMARGWIASSLLPPT